MSENYRPKSHIESETIYNLNAPGNAFNQSTNTIYQYTEVDVSYISYIVMKEYTDNSSCIIAAPLSLKDSSSLNSAIKSIIQQHEISSSIILVPLAIDSRHWAVLCLYHDDGRTKILYKDSMGGDNLIAERERLKQVLIDHLANADFKYSKTKEQTDASSSGIFTLNNMQIIARELMANKVTFLANFEEFEFTSQDIANGLRSEDFAIFFKDAILEETVIKSRICHNYEEGLEVLKVSLNNIGYKLKIFDDDTLFDQSIKEAKTIGLYINIPIGSGALCSHNCLIYLSEDISSESERNELLDLIFKKLNLPQETEKSSLAANSSVPLNPIKITIKSSHYHTQELSGWFSFSLELKIEFLKKLKPCTPNQFYQLSQNPNIQIELSNLLRSAIEQHNVDLVKIVLKVGLNLNSTKGSSKMSFSGLLQRELYKDPSSSDLDKISKLLAKYGCFPESSGSKHEELKRAAYDQILTQLAKDNHTTKEKYSEFIKSLKSKLLIAVDGLKAVASGKVSPAESDTFKTAIEQAMESVLSEMPIIGKLLTGLILDAMNHNEVEHIFAKIEDIFESNTAIDNIIMDYSIGVIRYDAEGILQSMMKSKPAKKEAVQKYVEKFCKFILDGEANRAKGNLGVDMTKSLFDDKMVHEQDLKDIEKGFSRSNTTAFAKLISFTEAVSHSRNTFLKWNFVQEVYQPNEPGWGFTILASPKRIIMCFSDHKKQNFNNFYHEAIHLNQDEQHLISLEVILEQVINQYRDAIIYMIGNKLGVPIAVKICQEKLINVFKLDSRNIRLYLYGTKTIEDQLQPEYNIELLEAKKYLEFSSKPAEEEKMMESSQFTIPDQAGFQKEHFHHKEGEPSITDLLIKIEQAILLLKDTTRHDLKNGFSMLSRGAYTNSFLQNIDDQRLEDIQNMVRLGAIVNISFDLKKKGPLISVLTANINFGEHFIGKEFCQVHNIENLEFCKCKSISFDQKFWRKLDLIKPAIRSGDLRLIKFLFEEKGCPNDKNLNLCNALLAGNLDLVKYFISQGADLNYSPIITNRTSLVLAVESGNVEVVEYLVDRGVAVNDTDKGAALADILNNGSTALCEACQQGHIEIVRSLIQNGARINAKVDQAGATALHRGIAYPTIVRFLIEKGANLDAPDGKGRTPLHYAANAYSFGIQGINISRFVASFKQLVDAGANMRVKDSTKQTPIDILNKKRDVACIAQYLIILELQTQMLSFYDLKQAVERLEKNNLHIYSIITYFVSECVRLENIIHKRHSKKTKMQDQKLIIYLSQFLEGPDKLQQYCKAVKLLLSYDSDRLNKVLAVCDQFRTNMDFHFIECLTHLNKIKSHFTSVSEKESSLRRIKEIELGPWERSYINGEHHYLLGEYEFALKHYESLLKSSPDFYQARSRVVDILIRKGDLKEARDLHRELSQYVMSIDVEVALQESMQMIATQDFIDEQAQTNNTDTGFEQSLKGALVIDAKEVAKELIKLLPKSSVSKELVKKHESILKEVDYAYDLLSTIWQKIFMKDEITPKNKENFFANVLGLIKKLKNMKEESLGCYSLKEGFNNDETKQQRFYKSLDDLVYYYEDYIQTVVGDYQRDQNPQYLKMFYQNRGKLLDVKKSIKVIAEDGGKYLFKREAHQFITMQGPKSGQRYGTHKVGVYPHDSEARTYYKYRPYAPGVEFAVSSLYNLIAKEIAPSTKLLKLTDGGKSVFYLASEGVSGRNLAEVITQPNIIQTICPNNFSALFISSLLTQPGDAKPDNFILRFHYDHRGIKYSELVSIDNDIAFCCERLYINSSHQTIYSDLLNVIYLMPQMDNPVSPNIRDDLIEQSAEVIISKWLKSLNEQNFKYEKKSGFVKKDLEESLLPIQLPRHTVSGMYRKLSQIITMLRSETVTHNDIFKALLPNVHSFYEESRDSVNIAISIKNLYAAAGVQSNLVKTLYDPNRTISSSALTALSSQKKWDKKQFKELFSQSIEDAAIEFLFCIDFSSNKVDRNIAEFGKNLSFVRSITLYRISLDKLKTLCHAMGNIESVTLLDCFDREACESWLLKKGIRIQNPRPSKLRKLSESEEIKPLEINSLWDLVDPGKRPADKNLTADGLMAKIGIAHWNINEVIDSQKNTVLHQAVLLNDEMVVRILLDCEIDRQALNIHGKTALDLCRNLDIALLILEHNSCYLWQLIRDRKFAQVEVIAKYISPDLLNGFPTDINDTTNTDIEDRTIKSTDSLLKICLKDCQLKKLAWIIVTKINKIFDMELIELCVQNYPDEDVSLLEAIVSKYTGDLRNIHAGDLAYETEKINMLVYLLNKGFLLSADGTDENIIIILKAVEWKFKIDASDLKNQFNYSKTNLDHNTIFHLMCMHHKKDVSHDICLKIFNRYKDDGLKEHLEVKNNQNKTVSQLAKEYGFVECLEWIYAGKDLYTSDGHILTKETTTKKLSQVLHKYGINISAQEAISGINLNNRADKKGNTAIQILIKKYINTPLASLEDQEEIREDIIYLLENNASILCTQRLDGNTALHLMAKSGREELIDTLVSNSGEKVLNTMNCHQQTAIDLAKIYGHEGAVEVIQNWIRELDERLLASSPRAKKINL